MNEKSENRVVECPCKWALPSLQHTVWQARWPFLLKVTQADDVAEA